MRDYTYIAVSNKGETAPWMLLRERDAQLCRWIPHLDQWVEMPGHWDWLSGFSTDSLTVDARTVTKAHAWTLSPGVIDLDDDHVRRLRARR